MSEWISELFQPMTLFIVEIQPLLVPALAKFTSTWLLVVALAMPSLRMWM